MKGKRIIKPADEIRQKVKGGGIVEERAIDILLVIESDIEKAIEKKADKSITEVQTNFDIPPMKREDAQRAVYFNIVKELKRNGYSPRIQFCGDKEGNQRVFIHVKWKTQTDEIQEKAMDEFIKKHAYTPVVESSKPPGSRRRRK